MRKYAWLSVLLLVAFVVAACGGGVRTRPGAAEPWLLQPHHGPPPCPKPRPPAGARTKLVIESWRNDDLSIWQDKIIPAFEAKYPEHPRRIPPAAPAEYNGVLNTKLEGGTAGDLITCRPFDASLAPVPEGLPGCR